MSKATTTPTTPPTEPLQAVEPAASNVVRIAPYPGTHEELERLWRELGANRDANWELARRLRQSDHDETLSDAQRRTGEDVCSTLILDMLFVLKGLGNQLLQVLRDPDPVNIRVARATWNTLSDDDRHYLECRLVGRMHFIDDFDDNPGPMALRVVGPTDGPIKDWPRSHVCACESKGGPQ